jgi:hypothetical protein
MRVRSLRLLPPIPGLQRRYWFQWEIVKYPAGKASKIQAAPGQARGESSVGLIRKSRNWGNATNDNEGAGFGLEKQAIGGNAISRRTQSQRQPHRVSPQEALTSAEEQPPATVAAVRAFLDKQH